ncbi:metalloregulator ArsR/SmtB family transcription factor [Arenibacter sp. M-2]|uniref:ArsR/SmtB family transcription factor n=1 Tax=Arenibacter sp. M-2 TaxID=3053612 RepID=UPI00256FE2CF|nr:metalloregulator ArsR/SmtB family transcription factor [Arenibacter sp. M-2]MDL5511154.1 metalloregulator ArsR/SmtB family transcription factor [Arenibacter sp. M-2]
MSFQQVDTFSAIADSNRRQILLLLSTESQSINSLAENFEISRPAISKHIKLLELSGFITIENIGRERHCKLKQDGFIELQNWLSFFDNFWKNKLNRLDTLMNKNQ